MGKSKSKANNNPSPRRGGGGKKGGTSTTVYLVGLVVVAIGAWFVSTSGSEGGGSSAPVSYDKDLPWLKATKTRCESCKVVIASSVAAVVKQRDRKLKKIKSVGGDPATDLELSADDAMKNMCLKYNLKWLIKQTTLTMGGQPLPKKFLDEYTRACRAMLGDDGINDSVLKSLQGEDGMEGVDSGIMNTAVLRWSKICLEHELCTETEVDADNIKYDEIYTPPKEDTLPKVGAQKSGRKKPQGLAPLDAEYEANDSDYDDLDINIGEWEEPDVGADEL